MGSIQWTIAGVVMASLWGAGLAGAQVPDHLECFKVKDPQAKASYRADVSGLVAEPGCTIKVPGTLFCTQTTKTNVDPPPPGGPGTSGPAGRFLCYKLKCPKATLPAVAWHDQFGSRILTTKRSSLVCAPEIVTTTTTTATTTTSASTTLVCTTAFAPCGSCGNGLCQYNCPGTALVCVGNDFLGPGCTSDADCTTTIGRVCAGGESSCASGPTGCAPLCP